ncbi:class D beta-lactamase [Polaribacter sp.]|uniref:class D beta-lactamase n=1 Tax=Polaribacter sp. TaxID=1920175 RepID=UPI003EF40E30
MKIWFYMLSFLFVSVACAQKQNLKENNAAYVVSKKIESLLETYNVNGAILIFDSKKNTYYSNDFTKGKETYLPASTYKIINTIIGLETGIIKNEQTVFKWNGEKRAMKVWEKDLILKDAFQKSCVPCYQEVARKIGVESTQVYLQKLQFGTMNVASETIDNFWLVGDSKISPFEQINFLNRFYENRLPITKTTTKIVKNIMKLDVKENFTLSGKTGLAISDTEKMGWFVGFVEVDKKVVYFATKISPKEGVSLQEFIPIRKKITILSLKELGILHE